MIELEWRMPLKTVSEANRSRKDNWRVKTTRIKQQRATTRMYFMAAINSSRISHPTTPGKMIGNGAAGRIQVYLKRYGVGTLDDDNLASAFKAIRDELAAVIGVDDGNPIYKWNYSQVKCSYKDIGVHVSILCININPPTHEIGDSCND